jgi:hypothetical protein
VQFEAPSRLLQELCKPSGRLAGLLVVWLLVMWVMRVGDTLQSAMIVAKQGMSVLTFAGVPHQSLATASDCQSLKHHLQAVACGWNAPLFVTHEAY